MQIQSSNKQEWYTVTIQNCTCPDYIYRQAAKKGKCKHMKMMLDSTSKVLQHEKNSHKTQHVGGNTQ